MDRCMNDFISGGGDLQMPGAFATSLLVGNLTPRRDAPRSVSRTQARFRHSLEFRASILSGSALRRLWLPRMEGSVPVQRLKYHDQYCYSISKTPEIDGCDATADQRSPSAILKPKKDGHGGYLVKGAKSRIMTRLADRPLGLRARIFHDAPCLTLRRGFVWASCCQSLSRFGALISPTNGCWRAAASTTEISSVMARPGRWWRRLADNFA
jgi:hypothetical protein